MTWISPDDRTGDAIVGLPTNTPPEAETRRLCDAYGRCLNNLRISVTQRCDLNCFFCHREGEDGGGQELTPAEIEDLVAMACHLGMTKVKITGGEPLLRDDIVDIVARVAQHAEEISLTTNGLLLEARAKALRDAGLHRVNVSLHALNPSTFQKIAGRPGLQPVKRGIAAALKYHLNPVKVNMVVLQGLNDHEVQPMIDYTARQGALLQLIEFQPVHHENWSPWSHYHSNLNAIEGWLAERAFNTLERPMHHRKQYYLQRDSGVACVEIVRPMHNSEFCQNCTRLRVTSDGKLKPCLLRNDNLIDVVPYFRGGKDWAGLEQAFRQAVTLRKPYWKVGDAGIRPTP